jgi:hypothetical protein
MLRYGASGFRLKPDTKPLCVEIQICRIDFQNPGGLKSTTKTLRLINQKVCKTSANTRVPVWSGRLFEAGDG